MLRWIVKPRLQGFRRGQARFLIGFLTTVVVALVFCPLVPVCAQELSFNGIPFDSRSDEVLLMPGTVNRAEITLPRGLGSSERLKVSWKLTTPLGLTRSGERQMTAVSPRASWDLGPLAVPPSYEFEAGEVFQKGYRLTVRLDLNGRPIRVWSFYQEHGSKPSDLQQGMGETEPLAQRVRLAAGERDRVVYNPRFGSLGPLSLRLGESVLTDQDDLEVRAKLNAGDTPERMQCLLRLTAPEGKEFWRQEVSLTRGAGWSSFRPDASHWPTGEYYLDLLPKIDGQIWIDGPRLRYSRRPASRKELLVSSVAPWKLERDPGRQEFSIIDFRTEHRKTGSDPTNWRWIEGKAGAVGAAGNGDFKAPPLVLRPGVRGYYAVFVVFEGEGGLLQVGRKGLIRGVALSRLAAELFVEAADLTSEEIRVYPSRDTNSKLVSLRLIPVTEASAKRLAGTLAAPPVPLLSVNDWAEYFGTSWARLLPDQFASIFCVQAEFGFRNVGWSVGRSWVEYPSRLPNARVFPCVPYDQAKKSPSYPNDPYDYGPRIVMMNEHDPLSGILEAREHCGAEVWPWLGMQRHYGESYYGGIFSCPFYREHPEWRRVSKEEKPSGLSFYYPEVRQERVDILMEVAERGADGLLVGCDRQVPMLLYEPAMVEEFRAQTGIDARKIDVSQRVLYEKWIRFRAGFFTETLRELKRRLDPLRTKKGRRIPVGIRIPSEGLFLNLAQGLDVEAWCREGLVDLIDLDPLVESPEEGSQDVRPYVSLARQFGIPVNGGVGSTAFRDLRVFGVRDWDFSVITPGLKRARGLHRAGVDGINTFETEVLTWTDPVRFAVALYGHPETLERFLEESNIEAVYPVAAGNAAAGHDNHSVWRPGWTWSMSGFGGRSY